MKKVFSTLAIAILVVSIMSVTAFAQGGNRQGNGNCVSTQANYKQRDGADAIRSHQQSDSLHCRQTGGTDGYAVCDVEGCTQLGLHEHDGEYFYCQNHGTGLGCGKNKVR